MAKKKLANNGLVVKSSDVPNVASRDGYQHGFASLGYIYWQKRVEELVREVVCQIILKYLTKIRVTLWLLTDLLGYRRN